MGYGRKPSWRSANYRYVAQPGDPPSTEPKAMKARFAGKCELCSGQILPGEDMLWIPATRKARHATCPANPTPVAATPQIACPKCGQQVYQQTSKYGKPYFTNSTNRQDFHPCRVWTGRRKYPVGSATRATMAPVNIAPLGSSPTASALPGGRVPNAVVQAAFDAMTKANWPGGSLEPIIIETEADVRTWSTAERDLAKAEREITTLEGGENGPETQAKYAELVTERELALNRLALLTWERIRYDS